MDIVRIIIVLLHFLFSIFTILIVLFSNDIITVMTTGLLLYAAFLYNYKCDDCPLSIMEDNYVKITSIDRFFTLFLKDQYRKDLRPLLTKELYWLSLTITLVKVLYLMFIKTVKENIKN